MFTKNLTLCTCKFAAYCLFASAIITHATLALDGVDLIIFSFDRPLQLEALLRSINTNIIGIASTSIIYRASNQRFENSYTTLKKECPTIQWLQQGESPTQDFKPLTMQAIHNGMSSYILFAVDDIIVKNNTNLHDCVQLLEQTGAYGFYLRLGTHLDYCYALSAYQTLPPLRTITPTVVAWTFGTASGDWAYPNTVDMTIFRKNMIINTLECLEFRNPNTLEKVWAKQQGAVMQQYGLCFENSIAMNIPMNLVQTEWYNPNLNKWSPAELLSLFEAGKRIDIRPLQGIKNHSCHTDCTIEFFVP